MENRILNDDLIDNRFFMDYDEAIELIKEKVEKKLPNFKIIKIFDEKKSLYYYVLLENKNIQIKIGGDRGGLLFEIVVDGKEYYLDKEIARKLRGASEKNTSLIIDIIAYEVKKINSK
ncbi:MAG: hypothetical protein E2590_15945 [Chryseobacterium sp.]|nr:hypothetical protein [Chryseobacterium sp.]